MPVRVLAGLLCAALLLVACNGDDPDPEPQPEPEPEAQPEEDEEPTFPLTGLPVDDPAAAERPVLAVKVDNAPRARPQTGLEAADVVFEERVEGDAVRFIALFHSDVPEVVGPVRSARPVDVEVLSAFERPVKAYSGARDEVAAMLDRSPLVLLTEGASGFYREPDRPAPHDLYVRAPETLEAGIEAGGAPVEDAGLTHDEEVPDGDAECPPDDDACVDPGMELAVDMTPGTTTSFAWDDAAGLYRRDQDGQPTEVVGDEAVGVHNVVVLATRHYESGCCDTAGQPYIDTDMLGADRAVVLRDGNAYAARWEKDDAEDPLRLVTTAGEPFDLAPGRTWVLLAPDDEVPGLPQAGDADEPDSDDAGDA